jgi:phage regulator Rha-like protein
MRAKPGRHEVRVIESSILTIRGQKVILDHDLAALYGVPTKVFNQAVKRNIRRFPTDFMFRLTVEEYKSLRSQFVTSNLISTFEISKPGRGGRRTLPYAFTEHGAVMAANVLRTKRAIQMSVFVVRAFIKMRALLTAQKDLAAKLATLERTLTRRLNLHERVISDIIQQIMSLLNPPVQPEPPRKRIGFHVRERAAIYRRRGIRIHPLR